MNNGIFKFVQINMTHLLYRLKFVSLMYKMILTISLQQKRIEKLQVLIRVEMRPTNKCFSFFSMLLAILFLLYHQYK